MIEDKRARHHTKNTETYGENEMAIRVVAIPILYKRSRILHSTRNLLYSMLNNS